MRRAILQLVAASGIVSLAVMSPNMLKIIPRPLLKKLFDKPRSARAVAISKLIAAGYLMREVRGNVRVLRITEKGKRYLERQRRLVPPTRPRTWDGKWRVVIFDIMEQHRSIRNRLRAELRSAGFILLQGSVWVYPYPCEEFIALLKSDVRVGKTVLYMVVDEIENDTWLKKEFDLPIPRS